MAGSQLSEIRMHWVRWLLSTGWLLIIGSLFFDPFSARFTSPEHPWSPLRLPGNCVEVQGRCLVETPYPLGTTIFWGAVVPAAIFILLVFGHELWRRICPLSFLSQIPRALGWQRQTQKRNPKSGELRPQLARLPPDSWLAKHYPALQFGWLYLGLCGRILFFNADCLVLAGWLLFTIAAAVAVGWLYGGKAWCQYFCPMAPVQSIYSTPGGLLGSRAHMSDTPITQSMCRTLDGGGAEQSACVACQKPCIDIDAERMYWERLQSPAFSFERYGYVGLVVGYFLYYYLYAGNWNYYFSGAWVRQSDQLAQLLSPGLFLFGETPLPRLVAVPLVLGLFTWLGWLGFPINRCHQRVVTAAPERACAAGDPSTACSPLTLAAAERGVKPVENAEILCAAGSRADRRQHWGLGDRQGSARPLVWGTARAIKEPAFALLAVEVICISRVRTYRHEPFRRLASSGPGRPGAGGGECGRGPSRMGLLRLSSGRGEGPQGAASAAWPTGVGPWTGAFLPGSATTDRRGPGGDGEGSGGSTADPGCPLHPHPFSG